MSDRRCRECGCTDLDCSGCIERTGAPCSWIAHDLCSACLPPGVEVRKLTPLPGADGDWVETRPGVLDWIPREVSS